LHFRLLLGLALAPGFLRLLVDDLDADHCKLAVHVVNEVKIEFLAEQAGQLLVRQALRLPNTILHRLDYLICWAP